MIVGARTAVIGPLLVALGAMLIGNIVRADRRLPRRRCSTRRSCASADLVYALPGLLVAIVIVGVVGGGYYLAVGLLVVLYCPFDTRLVRAATLEQRRRPYVEAARTLGLSRWRIMFLHIWPNVLPIAIANAMLAFAFALVSLARSSFLGIGVAAGRGRTGARCSPRAARLLFQNPWTGLAPGIALVLTAASVNVIGDWLFERLSDAGRDAVSDVARRRGACGSSPNLGRQRRTIVAGHRPQTSPPGETVGIVGESGSGKSLTARALLGLLPPGVTAAGERALRRRGAPRPRASACCAAIRGRHIALLLQDPYTLLNPLMRGRASRSPQTLDERRAVEAEAARSPRSASPMRPWRAATRSSSRAGCASASASPRRSRSNPEILIADEPSTALDVTTQKEILKLLRSIQEQRGMGLVLITHDLRVAFSMCDRIYVLYAGLDAGGGAGEARSKHEPLHPYTLGLLALRAAARPAARTAHRDRGLGARARRRRRQLPVRAPLRWGARGLPRGAVALAELAPRPPAAPASASARSRRELARAREGRTRSRARARAPRTAAVDPLVRAERTCQDVRRRRRRCAA